jgi:hypothetical protein
MSAGVESGHSWVRPTVALVVAIAVHQGNFHPLIQEVTKHRDVVIENKVSSRHESCLALADQVVVRYPDARQRTTPSRRRKAGHIKWNTQR